MLLMPLCHSRVCIVVLALCPSASSHMFQFAHSVSWALRPPIHLVGGLRAVCVLQQHVKVQEHLWCSSWVAHVQPVNSRSLVQIKGKAAIDVICNPLGKSGGALIQQVMIVAFGSLAASTPYLGVILLGIVLLWLRSAKSLDKQFTGATRPLAAAQYPHL